MQLVPEEMDTFRTRAQVNVDYPRKLAQVTD